MPAKQVITREQILECASEIVIEKGFQHITARNIAIRLKCSTQPLYWYFRNIDELSKCVYLSINKKYIGEMLFILEQDDFFLKMTKWLIDITKKSQHLFGVLFYYIGYDEEDLFDVMRSFADDKEMILKLKEQYQLSENGAKIVYMRCCVLWASVHSQIRNRNFFKNEQQFLDFMLSMFNEMVEIAKRKD